MNRKTKTMVMLITILVLGVAIIVSAVLLVKKMTGLKDISISPSFTDTELDINQDYIINVKTDPEGMSIKKFKFNSDSSSATFEYKSDGVAVLHTSSEGAVTVYVSKGNIESNRITYNVVDKVAKQAAEAAAQAAAEAEAEAERLQAEAEAEEAAAQEAVIEKVRVIKDSVNVRAEGNTDCDIVGKAQKGDVYLKIEDNGEWTQIDFNGKTGFIRNDMIETTSGDEAVSEGTEVTQETKNEEKKEEKKPEDEQKKADDEAKKKAEEEAKKAEEAAKLAEAAAAEAAAAEAMAAAAAQLVVPAASGALPASGPWTYQGVTFTANQVAHFHALWDYTGDAAEMVSHHSAGELQTVCQVDGIN